MAKTPKKRGRPAGGKNSPQAKVRPQSELWRPKYKTPKRMQNAVDRYFISCNTHSIHELVLWLGFDDYEGFKGCNGYNESFKSVISRAITRIKAEYEQRLADRTSARGAEFALKAMGFGDRTVVKIEDDPLAALLGKISTRSRIPTVAEKKRIKGVDSITEAVFKQVEDAERRAKAAESGPKGAVKQSMGSALEMQDILEGTVATAEPHIKRPVLSGTRNE